MGDVWKGRRERSVEGRRRGAIVGLVTFAMMVEWYREWRGSLQCAGTRTGVENLMLRGKARYSNYCRGRCE